MANLIAVVILIILVGSAVVYLIKAKKSGVKCIGCPAGGSCPSSKKMKKKKLRGRVIGKKKIQISGMHCAHCVASVTESLNQIDGVRADVDLSKGSAIVSYDREVDDTVLKNAVERVGFSVVSIHV